MYGALFQGTDAPISVAGPVVFYEKKNVSQTEGKVLRVVLSWPEVNRSATFSGAAFRLAFPHFVFITPEKDPRFKLTYQPNFVDIINV